MEKVPGSDKSAKKPQSLNHLQANTDLHLKDERRRVDEVIEHARDRTTAKTDQAMDRARSAIDDVVGDQQAGSNPATPKQIEVTERMIDHERERMDKAMDAERAEMKRVEKTMFEYERCTTDDSLRTERDRAKEMLSDSRRAVSLREESMAILSHDLRNPLMSIQLAADALDNIQVEGARARFIKQNIGIILRSARSMQTLIDRLLNVERFEQGKEQLKLQEYDLFLIAAECVELERPLAEKKDIEITLQSREANTVIRCDRQLVMQAIDNLLSNAIKFAPEGGRIEVEVTGIQPGMIAVKVTDDGPGIPDEEKQRIFKRFQQAQQSLDDNQRATGLGLGLYISHQIVEAHNGKIWVQDAPGGGASFYMAFPTSLSN